MTKYRRNIFTRRSSDSRWKDYTAAIIAALALAWFAVYSVDAKAADAGMMIDIIECESSGRHNASGDGGASYGIAQFKEETFYRFSKRAGLKNMQYKNPVHQLRVMSWALDNGYGNHWTCYQKLFLMGETQ